MATPITVVQRFDAPAAQVFALFSDRDFLDRRLQAGGGLNPQVVALDSADGVLTVVTQQGIPSSVLPSFVASFLDGDPVTERTEAWRTEPSGFVAEFGVVIKGAPARLNGTMTLADDGDGSTLAVAGEAVVPIPFVGGKVESMIVEQVEALLAAEESFTQQALRP